MMTRFNCFLLKDSSTCTPLLCKYPGGDGLPLSFDGARKQSRKVFRRDL